MVCQLASSGERVSSGREEVPRRRTEKFRPQQNCLSLHPPPWVPTALGHDCAEPSWTPGVRPGLSRGWLLPRARLPEAESSSSSVLSTQGSPFLPGPHAPGLLHPRG